MAYDAIIVGAGHNGLAAAVHLASRGGSHHLDQHFMFRPAFGWSRYKAPLDALYLMGAATWPGAGSGFLLARQLAGH